MHTKTHSNHSLFRREKNGIQIANSGNLNLPIGTELDQIPLNAYLGLCAFLNPSDINSAKIISFTRDISQTTSLSITGVGFKPSKILLMGMSVEIQRAEVNGLQVNRVRVGPFARIDDMNQTRTRLGQEKIPTAVVRQ